jgi:hypothetical protein
VMLPASDDGARAAFGAAGRSRRFARVAVCLVFVRCGGAEIPTGPEVTERTFL